MAQIVTITNPLTGQPAQVDQLDHTAQQIDDGLNIARGVSNPNLLDNWYFGNPVNQRGQTEYTAAGYTVDRWKLEADGTMKSAPVVSSGIALSNGDGTTYLNFAQIVDKLPAGTYIVSFLVDDFSNVNQVFCAATNTSSFTFDSNVVSLTFTLDSDSDSVKIGIQKKISGNALTVKAAKLELGTQQTLAHQDADGNWVLNEIPDYGEQLARCQRYFVSIRGGVTGLYTNFAFGYASSNNFAYVTCPIPVAMRVSPAISSTGSFRLSVNGGKSTLTVTAIESGANSTATLIRLGVKVASGTTQGDIIMLQADNDNTADIYLSADL